MKTTYIMFIRHGETFGNQEQIAHGQTESPLNERGIAQAASTAERLKTWHRPYKRVYASTLSRALDTAKHVSEALALPLHTNDGLKEGSLGDWEGVTYQELSDLEFAKRSIKDDDFDGHNGESPNQLAKRMVAALNGIRTVHQDENIIIVSHGAAIAHTIATLLETKPVFGYQYIMHNSAITELAFTPTPSMECFNLFDHLPEHLKTDPTGANHNVDNSK